MTQLILTLMEHPVLFTLVLLSLLSFIGMTYEFLLRLFNRNSLLGEGKGGGLELGDGDSDNGCDNSGVPVNPDPDDILHVENSLPDGESETYSNSETAPNVDWVKNKDYEK